MKVFVDTSAFAALENRKDARHAPAVREYRRLIRSDAILITSDYVFDETITLLGLRAGRAVAHSWGRRFLASALFQLEIVDRGVLEESLRIYGASQDQPFSFTDCSSFALMRAGDIGVAFGFDDDFVRYGFDQTPSKR